jgi:hypothetical protein
MSEGVIVGVNGPTNVFCNEGGENDNLTSGVEALRKTSLIAAMKDKFGHTYG